MSDKAIAGYLRANARVEKVKGNESTSSILEVAADTLQELEHENAELRKQLEQAEARCTTLRENNFRSILGAELQIDRLETALQEAAESIQAGMHQGALMTIQAALSNTVRNGEATSPASPTATAPKTEKPE